MLREACCRNTGGGRIGESGGHGWPTTSMEGRCWTDIGCRGAGALEWVHLAWEPRDSVGCLARLRGNSLGKGGSLHRPEAIEQEVYSGSPCRVGARAKDARPDKQAPQSWRSHH